MKRSIYWNNYSCETKEYGANEMIRIRLDSSWQGVKRLFVFSYDHYNSINVVENNDNIIENSANRYFLPRGKINNYNIEIDGRNFCDQPINDMIRQYDEVRKIALGAGDDYTTGCLLDLNYFKNSYKIIAVDLSKQKVLDADPRAIQQVTFIGKNVENNTNIYFILEQSKRNCIRIWTRCNKSILTYL